MTCNWQPESKIEGLQETYTIEKLLGSGGFGITYLAKKTNGQYVVIKTLHIENIPPNYLEKFRKDFYNEALRLAKFSHHPNIVDIIEVIPNETCPCIVMEYIDGQDLEALVKPRNLLEEEALHYIKQIGSALTFMHEDNYLHRDVKPHNILIRNQTQEAILIDFGIARKIDPDRNTPLTAFQSGGYTPPEQIGGFNQTIKSSFYTDVYGLAATLYYSLTKQMPAEVKVRLENMALNQTDPLKDREPQLLNPNISDSINRAIMQGLSIYPENRPQTIQAWLNLLETPSVKTAMTLPMTSQPTSIQSPQPPQLPVKNTTNYRKYFLLLGGILAASVTGFMAFWETLGKQNELNPLFSPQTNLYSYNEYGLKLNYPQDWQFNSHHPNSWDFMVAEFTAPGQDANIDFKTKLIVEVQDLPQNKTLEQISRETIEEIQENLPQSQIIENRQITINARQAYQLVYTGKDDNQFLKKKRIEIIKDNKLYILTYEAQASQYFKHEPTAQAIIDSLSLNP